MAIGEYGCTRAHLLRSARGAPPVPATFLHGQKGGRTSGRPIFWGHKDGRTGGQPTVVRDPPAGGGLTDGWGPSKCRQLACNRQPPGPETLLEGGFAPRAHRGKSGPRRNEGKRNGGGPEGRCWCCSGLGIAWPYRDEGRHPPESLRQPGLLLRGWGGAAPPPPPEFPLKGGWGGGSWNPKVERFVSQKQPNQYFRL